MLTIHSFSLENSDPQAIQGLAALWQAALGAAWPISAESLAAVLACPMPGQRPGHFAAWDGDHLVGFVGTQFEQNTVTGQQNGWIMTLMVAPEYQRQGIGRRLLDTAVEHLRGQGAGYIQAGGKTPRFFPGVPGNLNPAMRFFRACGWKLADEQVYDLARNLINYQMPAEIEARMAAENITVAPATEADVPEVLALNREEFAGWHDTYKFIAEVGDYADFLVARDPVLGVVGTLNMYGPGSSPRRADCPWKVLLGAKVGAMNEVGVAERARGRGIGIALVAYGSQVLKARGVGNTFIGWTDLVAFYGKLGYAAWKDYTVATP